MIRILRLQTTNLEETQGMGRLLLTAPCSCVAFVTFTCKAVFGVVWDADSFVAAKVHFARLADTLF